MALRQIIEIDESRCNGCGQCIRDCAEGALEIVNGKAKVVADSLCDGLGACLSGCPQDALKIIWRDAEAFDESAVHARQHQQAAKSAACSCPGSAAQIFPAARTSGAGPGVPAEQMRHWPVKLRLVSPSAPFLRGAQVLITADCAGAASASLHAQTAGKLMLIACPKFEDREEVKERIRTLIACSGLQSLDVLRMEVPCCSGLTQVCRQAAQEAGAPFQVREFIMRRDGSLMQAM